MVIVGPIRKIQLETSNLCNFNCSICPREKLNVIKKVLDFKFYKLILKKTQGTKYLDLTGWGEPLLNPKILKMIEEAKKKKFYLSFTTNAYLLDKKIGLGLIESGLDEISFSLDSLSKIKESDHFGRPAQNIINFMQLRPRMKIRIQTVMLDHQLERLKRIIDFAQENKITKVRLMRLEDRLIERKRIIKRKDERKIFFSLLKFCRKKTIDLEIVQYRWGDFPFNILTEPLRKIFLRNVCPKLFSSCYVNINGEVTPCCSLPHLIMGDLRKEELTSIWKNKKFNRFRRNYKNYCAGCETLTE